MSRSLVRRDRSAGRLPACDGVPLAETTRRRFLGWAAGSCGAACAGVAGSALGQALAGGPVDQREDLVLLADPASFDPTAPVDPNDYVDAHIHVWTPDTERYPLAAGYRREEMRPASFTPAEFWAQARPAGVGRVVLVQMSFYGFDHTYLLDVIRQAPARYGAIAVIDDDAAEPAAEMRRLAEAGVRGFRIYPRNRPLDRWLTSRGMEAMWRAGAENGLAMCCLVNPAELTAVAAMCRRFPDTPVVIDHLGRLGMSAAATPQEIEALLALAGLPRTYVKVSAFYALGEKRPPYADLAPLIRRVYEAFGPRRLMWGSDCPFQIGAHTYRDSLDFVRERLDFLTADDRRWLLRDTAAGLFFG